MSLDSMGGMHNEAASVYMSMSLPHFLHFYISVSCPLLFYICVLVSSRLLYICVPVSSRLLLYIYVPVSGRLLVFICVRHSPSPLYLCPCLKPIFSIFMSLSPNSLLRYICRRSGAYMYPISIKILLIFNLKTFVNYPYLD